MGHHLGEEFVHGAPDLVVGLSHASRIEVGAKLAEHVLVPRLLEIDGDDFRRIGLDGRAALAEFFGGPLAEKLVAAGERLEPELLVMRACRKCSSDPSCDAGTRNGAEKRI